MTSFCKEHDLEPGQLIKKVQDELTKFGASSMPVESICSADAAFAILNARPAEVVSGTDSDSIHEPIYFLGLDPANVQKNSNPHVDRILLLSEKLRARAEPIADLLTAQQSVLPKRIRGIVSYLIFIDDLRPKLWVFDNRKASNYSLSD